MPVGCKDYDDDIKGLKDDIEDLKGKIELKADKSAFDQLKSKVDAIDLSIYATKADLGAYVKTEDLAAKLKELNYLTKSEIEALGFQKEADVKKIFNDMLTADAIMAKITQQVKNIAAEEFAKQALTDAQKSQALAAIVAAINADTETVPGIQAAIKGLLGKEFANYMATYISTGAFDSDVDAAAARLLEDANSELAEKINQMISDGNGISTDNLAYLQENDLKTVFDNYDEQLEAVWAAVKDLAGRIQSLVFVPAYEDGKIVFTKQFIESGANTIMLNKTAKAAATFRVTPASLASKLVEQYKAGEIALTFMEEELATRAQNIAILDVVAGEAGKINLTLVAPEYDFAKKLAVALNIAAVPAEGDTMQGIEFSSAYVVAEAAANADVSANLKVAKLVDDNYVEVTTTSNLFNLPFNSTETINIFDGISVVYNDNGEFISLADAAAKYSWDVTPEMKMASTAFTNFATSANYTVAPANPLLAANVNKPVSVKIAATKQGVVGEFLSLTTTYSVTDGTKDVEVLGSAVSKVTITKALLSAITLPATYNWNYTAYAADSFAAEITLPAGKLTAAQFNAAQWGSATWAETKPANSAVVGILAATAAKVSTPSADGDTQIIKLTVTGYKNGTGVTSFKALVDIDANNAIEVVINPTFNGLPNMEYTIAVPSATYTVNGAALDVVATTTLNTVLFAALPAGQKYFASQSEFNTFLTDLDVVEGAAQAKVVATKTPAADVAASNDSKTLTVKFTAADIDFNAATSFAYAAPAAARLTDANKYFSVALKGGVTISKNNSYYLAVGTTLNPAEGEGQLPYQMANGVTVWATPAFTINNVLLPTGYAAKSPANSTATVATTYSLVTTAPAGYIGTLPTIDGGTNGTTGIFDWNKCALEKVVVKAVMTVDGVTLDTKTWEVRLQQPITFGWSDFSKTTNEKVATNTDKEVNLFSYMYVGGTDKTKYVVKDIFGNELVTATGIATQAADAAVYGFAVTFDEPEYSSTSGAQDFSRFEFDNATGILTCKADNAPLAGVVTATVKAYFSYQYSSVLTLGSEPPVFANKEFMKTVTVKFENQ